MMFYRGYNVIEQGCSRFASGGWGMIGAWILIALAIIAAVVLIVAVTKKSDFTRSRDNELMQTLKMKYVNGEISEEEYLKRKEILKK